MAQKKDVKKESPLQRWSKDRSVFDPLHEQVLKRLVGGAEKIFGDGTDPADLVTPLAGPLIAAIRPRGSFGMTEGIKFLKTKGEALLEKVKNEGLARWRGVAPSHIEVPNAGQMPDQFVDWSAYSGPEPNIKLEGDPSLNRIKQALEFAQARYPRQFGHMANISDVERNAQEEAWEKGGRLLGDSAGTNQQSYDSLLDWNKFSYLGLDPMKLREAAIEKGMDPARTVGHELLHNADRIVMGNENMMDRYMYSNTLPGGYDTNSFEIRANLQGEKFAEKLDKWLESQGRARKIPIK